MDTAEGFLGVAPSASDFLGASSAADFLGPPPTPAPAPLWTPTLIQQHAGPGTISSAQRSATHNAAVGGSPTSSHLTNQAMDFVPQDGDTGRAAKALAASGVPYDQIIDEGDHVHVGWGPKMRRQFVPRSMGGQALDFLHKAVVQPAENVMTDWNDRAQQGAATFMEGSRQMAGNGQAADPLNTVGGIAKMGGGALQWLMSPVSGAAEALVGRPLERATANAPSGHIGPVPYDLHIPKSLMGDYVDSAAGFLLGAPEASEASIPASVKYRAFKPTPEEAASAIDSTATEVAPAASAKPSASAFLADEAPSGQPTPQTPPAATPEGPAATASEFLAPSETPPPAEAPNPIAAAKVEDPYDDIIYAPRKPGTLSLPPADGATVQPRGLKEGMQDAAGAVQSILAPATKGEGRDAAATIRRASAESDLLAARSAQALVKVAPQVSELSVPEQRGLVSYIENRSLGAQLGDPKLQSAADAIRDVNQTYRDRIEQVMGIDEGPSFVRDYYTHLWKDSPDVVESRILAGRQGSGKNLKARSIPTLQEGIDAGLTPVTENPIEATLMYASNMSKYLSTVDAQKDLADSGYTKWSAPGQQPPGWVPLQGIRTEKAARTIVQDGETTASLAGQKLFAPPDVARVYNNWISSGFDRGDTAGLFAPIRKAANGLTMLKLGLSGFHATTMAQEAVISEFARGIGAASRGDLLTAGKAIGAAPGAFVGRAIRGNRMRSELLGLKPAEGLSAQVNDAFIRAGGRVRMDPLLRTRGAGSFYNAIHNGTWKAEIDNTASRIFGKGRLGSERAMGVVDLGANLIQSTAAPIFESYVPRLKQGAFASNMEDWLKANPGAAQKEIDTAAYQIVRSIDNRFGEMAWDNLFWHRWLKQASQVLLISPTWNLGTINEIGGGLADMFGPSVKGLVTGKGITQRTAYVAALAAYVPLINGLLTYLKTGQAPEGMDYAAYRTGGTDASSDQPERAMLPGYQKDVYSFAYDFPNHIGEEVGNKLNPALKLALEEGANKDFRGLPIRPGRGAIVQPGDKGQGDYLLDTFMPISLGQLAKGDKIGSNLSLTEKVAGVRPAPMYLTAPDMLGRIDANKNRKAWNDKRRADLRAANRREP